MTKDSRPYIELLMHMQQSFCTEQRPVSSVTFTCNVHVLLESMPACDFSIVIITLGLVCRIRPLRIRYWNECNCEK